MTPEAPSQGLEGEEGEGEGGLGGGIAGSGGPLPPAVYDRSNTAHVRRTTRAPHTAHCTGHSTPHGAVVQQNTTMNTLLPPDPAPCTLLHGLVGSRSRGQKRPFSEGRAKLRERPSLTHISTVLTTNDTTNNTLMPKCGSSEGRTWGEQVTAPVKKMCILKKMVILKLRLDSHEYHEGMSTFSCP